jgi:hypothetical protein
MELYEIEWDFWDEWDYANHRFDMIKLFLFISLNSTGFGHPFSQAAMPHKIGLQVLNQPFQQVGADLDQCDHSYIISAFW